MSEKTAARIPRLLVCALLVTGAPAAAQLQPYVSAETQLIINAPTFTEVKIKATLRNFAGSTVKWCDFHIKSPKYPENGGLPGLIGSTVEVRRLNSPGTPPQSWSASQTDAGYDFVCPNGTGFCADGKYSLTVRVKTGASNVLHVAWTATDSGDPDEDCIINDDGVSDDDDGEPTTVGFPHLAALAPDELPENIVAIGDEIPLVPAFDDTLEGATFAYFTSLSRNFDFSDGSGLSINADSDPIPDSWRIDFDDSTGLVRADGDYDGVPTLSIPADTELIDQDIWIVIALVDPESEILAASAPSRVLIVAP